MVRIGQYAHRGLRSSMLHTLLGAGLQAFELPLAYIRRDKFNQPIFTCDQY